MSIEKLSRSIALKRMRNLAHIHEWEEIADQQDIYMISFARNGERINIYYGRTWNVTVATTVTHPVWGRQQLFRKHLGMDELEKIFVNTRAHTGKGYYQKGAIKKMENKKWQNLLYQKCPKCNTKLQPCVEKAVMYQCLTPKCEFLISRRKYAEILMDKEHIMRNFLTKDERVLLEQIIKNIN